jgi:hypothetical protein
MSGRSLGLPAARQIFWKTKGDKKYDFGFFG